MSTQYRCNETGQFYGPMSPFLHTGQVQSKDNVRYYALAHWRESLGFIHVHDFMGRRQANRVTRLEKNNLAQYFGRTTALKYKFIPMSPTPAENIASKTYRLRAATMVSLALRQDFSHCTFDYSAFTDHMPNIIEHGLCEFPQIGDEPLNLTPQELQIPPSQAIGPLTSTPVKDRGPPRVVCGSSTAIAMFRSNIVIPRSETEPHNLGVFNERSQFCRAVYYSKETNRTLCCKKGQVVIPPVKQPATFLKSLSWKRKKPVIFVSIYGHTMVHSLLAVLRQILSCKSCYVVQGQVYSDASDYFPQEGQPPSMNQLWFVETDESAGIRCEEFDVSMKPLLIQHTDELQSCNPYAQGYQMMGRHIRSRESARCQLVIASDMAKVSQIHPGITHQPTVSKVAVIFFTEGDIHEADFLVTSSTDGTKKRLSTWNPMADPMLFPLLFPSLDVGYEKSNSYRSPLRGNIKLVWQNFTCFA